MRQRLGSRRIPALLDSKEKRYTSRSVWLKLNFIGHASGSDLRVHFEVR
jgi:hypothetical protein